MKRVLFLCTGNSCRSQMAQALLRQLGQGQFQAFSAGAKPSGHVHPLALKVLAEARLPTESLRSKSWEEFKDEPFDFVITVCDNAKESCPIFPGKAERIHWSIQDPAEVGGTDEDKMAIFLKVLAELRQRLSQFVSDRGEKAVR